VLVLQASQPGVFAAGADISEFEATYRDAAEAERASREINDAVDALQACPLPVVALIDGPCVGGGVALAVACDIRLASDRARFAVTPARLGLSYHPDDLRRLVRACGLARRQRAAVWRPDLGRRTRLARRAWSTRCCRTARPSMRRRRPCAGHLRQLRRRHARHQAGPERRERARPRRHRAGAR
jgi:enoyl-CoA hydratase/carnithine racemase